MRLVCSALAAGCLFAAGASAQVAVTNDYPTVARADYVFGCMATNGQSRQSLERCACSVDVIASILPYEQYIEAETIMAMAQGGGERMAIFRTAPHLKAIVADLRRAQAEAEIRCF
jgi:lysyl-tRNA synthetase class II